MLRLRPGTEPNRKISNIGFKIFKGKTPNKAAKKAQKWLLADTRHSRADYEEEHGKITDEQFLEQLDKGCGFRVVPAALHDE
jgi:hypothetical protein